MRQSDSQWVCTPPTLATISAIRLTVCNHTYTCCNHTFRMYSHQHLQQHTCSEYVLTQELAAKYFQWVCTILTGSMLQYVAIPTLATVILSVTMYYTHICLHLYSQKWICITHNSESNVLKIDATHYALCMIKSHSYLHLIH